MSNHYYQYLAALSAQLSIITSGMHYAWPSPSLPILLGNSSDSPLKITSDDGSWMAITPLFGGMIASTIAGYTTDIVGRKKTILATGIPFVVAWIVIAFTKSVVLLIMARLMVGLTDGFAFTVIPFYISEIADPKIRGMLGASISCKWSFGMLLINVIGSYCTIKVSALISAVVPVLLVLTFIWMPESPYFYIMKSDYVSARQSLVKLKGRSDVEDELERLKEAVKSQTGGRGKFIDMFVKKTNQKALLILVILRNAQQMSGVAVITFYTQTIFREATAGSDVISPITATIFYVAIQTIMSGVCSLIIDKTGRRPLLIMSLIGTAICLLLEGLYFYLKNHSQIDMTGLNYIPVVGLLGYVIIFYVGLQPIPMLMQSELFPTNVRAFGSCLSEMYFCIVASTMSKLFQVMNDNVGIYLPFLLFSFCSFINLILVVIFVPETKGKTLEDIQILLGHKLI